MNIKSATFLLALLLKAHNVLSEGGETVPIITIAMRCVEDERQMEFITAIISSNSNVVTGEITFGEYGKKSDKEVSIYFLNHPYGSTNEKMDFAIAKDWLRATDKTKKGMICLAKTNIIRMGTGNIVATSPFEQKNVEVTKLVTEKAAQFINRIAGKSVVRVTGMYAGATHAGEFLYHLQRIREGQQADDLLAFEPADIEIPSAKDHIRPSSAKRVQLVRIIDSRRTKATGHFIVFIKFPSRKSFFPDIFRATATKTHALFASPAKNSGGMIEYTAQKLLKSSVPMKSYLIGIHTDFTPQANPVEVYLEVTNPMLDAIKSDKPDGIVTFDWVPEPLSLT